jgi:SAM-dependent methyltransferase
MSFSKEWDVRYKENTHLSIWPWSDLVSFVMRYVKPRNWRELRVLELGCGAGANIPFFKHLGCCYHAIEGSSTIVNELHARFPEYQKTIVCGDFTVEIPFSNALDLVVDRGSLTNNTTGAIRRALSLVHGALKPGGKFIGIDWFSTECTDYQRGATTEDHYTRTGYTSTSGALQNVGSVHFSDKAHLLDLFSKFKISTLEHKAIRREIPEDDWYRAVWNLAAERV